MMNVVRTKSSVLLIGLGIFCLCCSKSEPTPTTPPTNSNNPSFSKGADVGWLTQMEAASVKFYDSTGARQECMTLLRSLGMNSIRLRVWVKPTGGWNGTADVVAKAKRAKDLGMKIMIDFHYSDTWADPGHQTKPASWANLSFNNLKDTVYRYTKRVMDTLKLNGVIPNWVQIGNETDDGMLWPDGRVSTNQNNFSNFAALITQGYNAVKAVSDTTKVILHISNGYDNSLFHWMFDGLKSNGAKFDIIGMSLYPSYVSGGWGTANAQCLFNMKDMIARYSKPVMIVEVGMPVNDPATAKVCLTDLISKTKSIGNGNGLGVLYWEPECYNNWQGYGLGAFDNTGKPTAALNAFK